MKGYFTYAWTHSPVDSGPRLEFRCLFKTSGVLCESDLCDAIEWSMKQVLFPDIIMIQCGDAELDQLVLAFQSPQLQQTIYRASTKTTLCVCSFDVLGRPKRFHSVVNHRPRLRAVVSQFRDQILKAGLVELFSSSHVLVQAPAGFVFVKPSGDRSSHFLRTEEALTDSERVQFLAFALLPRLAARDLDAQQPLEIIFVDTMAISSVAYALREAYCHITRTPPPRIVSFHSYERFEDIEIPLPKTSFCIISASSSMRLERLWRERTQCLESEVITILTLNSAERAKNALIALPTPGGWQQAKSSNYSSVLKDLRIVGERFHPEQIPPKKVLLRTKLHSNDEAKKAAECLADGIGVLRVQARGPVSTSKVRGVFLDGGKLIEIERIKNWIETELKQSIPASVQTIIYQGDPASKALACYCQMRLMQNTNGASTIPIISESKLARGRMHLDNARAVVVVAAVIGRGTRLLSISRDLRNHTGARTYLIGAQVAESAGQIALLRMNLEYSSVNSRIVVERYLTLAVGSGLSSSYENEETVLKQIRGTSALPTLVQRIRLLRGSADGFVGGAFLPTGLKLDKDLELRPDFAFWKKGYTQGAHNDPAVFATIAAVLQGARENIFETPENRLASDAFQQVVLDPENFSRYNDGVIQAAILRAARPSELDYSSEFSASEYMLNVLTKIFEQHDQAQGEAALEFAIALRTKRLKLTYAHFEELYRRVLPFLKGNAPQKRILRRLLSPQKTRKRVGVF